MNVGNEKKNNIHQDIWPDRNINFKVIFVVGRIMSHSYPQRCPHSNLCESVILHGKGELRLLVELTLLIS